MKITEDVRNPPPNKTWRKRRRWRKRMAEPSAARSTIRRIPQEGETQRSQKSKEFVEKGAEVYATA